MVRAYVDDYLTSEIAAEALVRSVPSFAGFLRSAAIGDTELVNFQNIARESAVSSPTVKEYYQIMVDTLLGGFVRAFTLRPKRRVIQAPKFYLADVGAVNHLAQRGEMAPGSELFGKALKSVICHELSAFREYHDRTWTLSYWRLASGVEVDFVIGDAEIAIEVKSSSKISSPHLKGLVAFGEDQPAVRRRIMVCMELRRRVTEDGIEIVPVGKFLEALWRGEIG